MKAMKNQFVFDNNIGSTLSLLTAWGKGVFKLIFSSSATVYNDNQPMPLKEKSSTEAQNTVPPNTS